MDRFRDAGFVTICVTNQPDVARGVLDARIAAELNAAVVDALGLDDLIACFHDDADQCTCRKPRPGMLYEGAARWHLELAASYLVGDRWRDVEAGRAAGCRTVLLERRWAEPEPRFPPDARAATIEDAAEWILRDGRTPWAGSID